MKPFNGSMRMSQENTLPAGNAPLPPRCRMEFVLGSGPHLTDEVHDLLRRRLRIASTIAASILTMFFVGQVWEMIRGDQGVVKGPDHFDRALLGSVAALLIGLSALLWSNIQFSRCGLRYLELLMFGSMAVLFADLQFRVYYPGNLAKWATLEALPRVLELGNAANNVRWFFLIVLYGMFIPNTWKRCAIVVTSMALTPIVLTVAICPLCAIMNPHTGTLLYHTTLVMSGSVAMAVFGSYRIGELQQQAYQARQLGQYKLHRKLGSGGMGEVHLGEHMLLRRACAIKLIRPDRAGDPTTMSRFEREVQAMATLTHWNTVEVFDYGRTDDGTFYYVMEYLPGLSLQELVDQHGPLPPGRAIHFLRQVCAALQEAHSIGLIHRDIKPSNILICKRGTVHDVAKLLDFGLVHEVGPMGTNSSKLTMQGIILGSPNFLAPEQARGTSEVDGRTDIYSLGALAYFLLTGQTPFVRETVMDLLAAHMKDEVLPPRRIRPEIPADLEDVILTCMRKNPDDRFANAESLAQALASCEAADDWDADQAHAWWQQDQRSALAEVVVAN